MAAADAVLRFVFDDRAYVHVGELRLRPPNMRVDVDYEDVPLSARSYDRREPGYPTQRVIMTTDTRLAAASEPHSDAPNSRHTRPNEL